MTKLELFELSKKFATFFSQAGVEKYSVIHLLSGNNKYALAMLGGILTIGAICSLSDVPSDYETIKYQVSFFRLQQCINAFLFWGLELLYTSVRKFILVTIINISYVTD